MRSGVFLRAIGWSLLCSVLLVGARAWAQQQPTPVADAGPDQSVADTDGLPGETVILDGSGSQSSAPGETELSDYRWTNEQGTQIASGRTASVRLPDGTHTITLTVSEVFFDGEGTSTVTARDQVVITVLASVAPIADAGPNRNVPDTDNEPGETVVLDGSASRDPDGVIVRYEWFRDGAPLGSSASPTLSGVRLPDGTNTITLVVHDNSGNTGSATVVLTVGAAPDAPVRPVLEGQDLDPNERAVARNLDDLCARLGERAGGEVPLTPEESDLLARCEGLFQQSDRGVLADTIEQLGAQEITAIRTQTLVLSQTHNQSIMDRMLALRATRQGRPAAALQVTMNGHGLPLGSLLGSSAGGGASADDAEPNALLNERVGIWLRASYGDGRKAASAADNGFKSRQWGMTSGVDYRFADSWVFGASVGYGAADLEFRPVGEGSLDTRSWTGSLYGSYSRGQLYFDGVINYADASYDSLRRIVYDEGSVSIDRIASGSTGGSTLSGGFALGYDLSFGGLTLSPSIGYSFVDVRVGSFVERGASGLNLAYDTQYFESATGEANLSISYVFNTRWGVLMPHVRGTFVREFEDDVEVFGVRFASDPFAPSSDPTPPILVRGEEPDDSYLRLAAGTSLQLAYGISGYAEYMRYTGFRNLKFQDFTVGLRVQRGFR